MQPLSLRLVMLSLCMMSLPSLVLAQESRIQTEAAPEDTIMPILRRRVDAYRKSVGLVVGIINRGERTIYTYGKLRQGRPRRVSGETAFEIGPVTQVLTAFLLADMAGHEELHLNDPISKFLPPDVHAPTRNGRQITLLHLATHTSGLPDLPPDYTPAAPQNPLAGYSTAQLYAFLSKYKPARDIGTTYAFSRIGAALLGHILELAAGKRYEALLVERVCRPFKMHHTRVSPTLSMLTNMAVGHDAWRRPVTPSNMPGLVGADALRSSAQDLLTFVTASLGYIVALPETSEEDSTALVGAFEATTSIRSSMDDPDLHVAMGWRVMHKFDRDILWQSGSTKGYHCFIGLDKRRRKGVVVLANTANNVDDIGFHILNRNFRLAPSPRIGAVRVNPLAYDAYTGTYAFDTGTVVTITREGDRLYGQPAGQPKAELIPEKEDAFYLKEEDAQISFVRNAAGKVTLMLFYQKEQMHQARKIE